MSLAISLYHPTGFVLTWPPLKTNITGTAWPYCKSLFELSPQRPSIQIYFEQLQGSTTYCQPVILHLPTSTLRHDNRGRSLNTKLGPTHLQSIFKHTPAGASEFPYLNKKNHHGGISLGAYLELKAELDASDRELVKLRLEVSALVKRASKNNSTHETLSAQIDTFEGHSEAQATVLYTIIGSILSVTLGRSKNGQLQSIYGNQSAIVEAITMQFPETPGLSKRTLDRKFAEARRRFAKAQQA